MTPLLTGVFASQISGRLNTFSPTGSYDALATYTVPSGGVSSITFAGLPTGGQYSHLQIRLIARTANGNNNDLIYYRFNDDSGSNYSWHYLQGDGSNPGTGGATSQSKIYTWSSSASNSAASSFGAEIIDILDYASTSKYKTLKNLGGVDNNGSGNINLTSGLWMNTNPINSITITNYSATNFSQYTQFSLYGVK
jgi:hypothetical protein